MARLGQSGNDFVDWFDLDPGIADVLKASLRILREAAEQQSSNVCRCLCWKVRLVRIVLDHSREQIRHRLALERWRPGEHLEQYAAKRPDVGALVDRQPFCLFGRQ